MGGVWLTVNSTMEIEFWQWFAGYGIKPNEGITEDERHAIFNERVSEFDKARRKPYDFNETKYVLFANANLYI